MVPILEPCGLLRVMDINIMENGTNGNVKVRTHEPEHVSVQQPETSCSQVDTIRTIKQ